MGKVKRKICAGSDSLHAEMIYAKSLAVALFTFGNAGLEISKAKQKGQQTTVSEACCGTLPPAPLPQWHFQRFIYSSFVLADFKVLAVQVELRSTSKMLNAALLFFPSIFFFGNNKYLVGQKTDLFYPSQKKILTISPSPQVSPPPFFLSYSSTPHLASFTCWQRLRCQHGNGFTGLGCRLSGETSHNTHIPPTLWSLLMCCGKMYSSFVFMVSTSAYFSFPWIASYIQLSSTCWVLLEGGATVEHRI